MTIRYPPRREPRVLAVATGVRSLVWAVADPWEIRGAGRTHAIRRTHRLAIQRLVRRERPTVVVVPKRYLSRLRSMRRALGVPFLPVSFPIAPGPIAVELYPEITLHAPSSALRRVAVTAVSAVLHGQFPPREYASTCQRTLLRRT